MKRDLYAPKVLVSEFTPVFYDIFSEEKVIRPGRWGNFVLQFENTGDYDAERLAFYVFGAVVPRNFSPFDTLTSTCQNCIFSNDNYFSNKNILIRKNSKLSQEIQLPLILPKEDSVRGIYQINLVVYYRYYDRVGKVSYEGAKPFEFWFINGSSKIGFRNLMNKEKIHSTDLSTCVKNCKKHKYIFTKMGISENRIKELFMAFLCSCSLV